MWHPNTINPDTKEIGQHSKYKYFFKKVIKNIIADSMSQFLHFSEKTDKINPKAASCIRQRHKQNPDIVAFLKKQLLILFITLSERWAQHKISDNKALHRTSTQNANAIILANKKWYC